MMSTQILRERDMNRPPTKPFSGPDAIIVVCDCESMASVMFQEERSAFATSGLISCLFTGDIKAPVYLVLTKADKIREKAMEQENVLPFDVNYTEDQIQQMGVRKKEKKDTKNRSITGPHPSFSPSPPLLSSFQGLDMGASPYLPSSHPFYIKAREHVERTGMQMLAILNLAASSDVEDPVRFHLIGTDMIRRVLDSMEYSQVTRDSFLEELREQDQEAPEQVYVVCVCIIESI